MGEKRAISNPKATSEFMSLKSDYEEECRLRKEAERERDALIQDNTLLADEVRGLEVELRELREKLDTHCQQLASVTAERDDLIENNALLADQVRGLWLDIKELWGKLEANPTPPTSVRQLQEEHGLGKWPEELSEAAIADKTRTVSKKEAGDE
jgi:uncharacterized coiled-coil DUF342 family protein